MIRISPTIALDDVEFEESFARASGPGGQHVNKVETAVRIRFDARNSPNLPDAVKGRLEKLAGARMTKDGVVVIESQRFRSQERNRVDARERLIELIAAAAAPPPPPRKKTRPTLASRIRRLEGKKLRANVKSMRGRPATD